jgi:hypothetical protein
LAVVVMVGCDEKPASQAKPIEPIATASAPASPPPKKPDPLAGLSVDDLGPFLKDTRIDMSAKDADSRLKEAVGKLPLKGQVVSLDATRNAKTQDVAVVVFALGQAGAQEIDVKTPGRSGAVVALKVLPETLVPTSLPDCAVVGMIRKDGTSAVWHLKGGTATKFHKGLAGPDLSMTLDGMKDQMKACAATDWMLAGEENVIWGLTFDLGQAVVTADPAPRATQTILLHEAPVAGRPVVLASDKSPTRR